MTSCYCTLPSHRVPPPSLSFFLPLYSFLSFFILLLLLLLPSEYFLLSGTKSTENPKLQVSAPLFFLSLSLARIYTRLLPPCLSSSSSGGRFFFPLRSPPRLNSTRREYNLHRRCALLLVQKDFLSVSFYFFHIFTLAPSAHLLLHAIKEILRSYNLVHAIFVSFHFSNAMQCTAAATAAAPKSLRYLFPIISRTAVTLTAALLHLLSSFSLVRSFVRSLVHSLLNVCTHTHTHAYKNKPFYFMIIISVFQQEEEEEEEEEEPTVFSGAFLKCFCFFF